MIQKKEERWKETCKKHVERRLHTLVEAVDQVEGSLPVEEGEELEKLVFPTCGETFNQSTYKVTVHAFVAQKPIEVLG